MGRGNPIAVRIPYNRSSDSSWFSDYYYSQLLYQDINLRSYFGSIRPPTTSNFGFRLGRCLLLHFPKLTSIRFFVPRGQLRVKLQEESRPSAREKGEWWAFGKVAPIRSLGSSKNGAEGEERRLPSSKKKKKKNGGDLGFFSCRDLLNGNRDSKTFVNFSIMQYWMSRKNNMHFDPSHVLNHFEPSLRRQMVGGGAAKVTNISLFPFFGATFCFLRDGVGSDYKGREQVWSQVSQKCWNLMGQDKVMELIAKCRKQGSTRELRKAMEMLIEIILRNRKIPYGYNSYLNEMKKMGSFLSERTKTGTSIESVKIKSVHQSASLLAQDIAFKIRNNVTSFRSILSNIAKRDIEGIDGIRVCCSGRLDGAEIARTECGFYGRMSCHTFERKIDYAFTEASTRYGILGIKVWISYK